MAPADLVIRNARVVARDRDFRGGVAVSDGQITAIFEGESDLPATDVIDAAGLVLMPGLVDGHVHFSEPGRGHWEGFETGSRAAAAGGITTFVEMPLNAHPPTVDAAALALKQQAAEKSVVDYALWGGLVEDNLADLPGLQAGGVVGFKAFMCTASDFPRVDARLMRAGMAAIAGFGSFLAVHAEDEAMTDGLTATLRSAGRTDRAAWGEARPIAAELAAIDQAIIIAAETGARLHIVHVSSSAGIDRISAAKARGIRVTAETCPHYLFFDETDLERIGPLAKCAPPLRAPAEREALWERVLAGAVDVIASDHSPCLIEEKTAGDADIFKAWGGISGLQSTLPVLLTEGPRRGLSLAAIARMTATNPARLFGLDPQKGAITVGADADLVLVDPDAAFTLAEEDLFYRNRHSAYVGAHFTGAIRQTISRGETVYVDGVVTALPRRGRRLEGRR
ncbi:allantoinase AllB [Mesorhizobium sp. BR1-1-16]|uniref:allantoinase AllB n=1 Tax=Mesorhizobium sp. BR1-1-16 TaxID=2876653 RepID=UPI001CCD935B|nr:allantoinase AllB [Mesorhizobium sp. BR1-1-16]MBZ9938359.1 allantoinase AllB [Mesorhizobium sp. BR1-1-16]